VRTPSPPSSQIPVFRSEPSTVQGAAKRAAPSPDSLSQRQLKCHSALPAAPTVLTWQANPQHPVPHYANSGWVVHPAYLPGKRGIQGGVEWEGEALQKRLRRAPVAAGSAALQTGRPRGVLQRTSALVFGHCQLQLRFLSHPHSNPSVITSATAPSFPQNRGAAE
jgi:hypothetical protein